MPATTMQATFDHHTTNYGGGEQVANDRLQKWCSRRSAARLGGQAQAGRETPLDEAIIEIHTAKQARNLRKASGDDGISPQVPRTLSRHTAQEIAAAANHRLASDDLLPTTWRTARLTKLPKGSATRQVKQQCPIAAQSLVVKATAPAPLSTNAEDLNPRHTNSYAFQAGGDIATALMPLLTIEKCHAHNDAQVWVAKLTSRTRTTRSTTTSSSSTRSPAVEHAVEQRERSPSPDSYRALRPASSGRPWSAAAANGDKEACRAQSRYRPTSTSTWTRRSCPRRRSGRSSALGLPSPGCDAGTFAPTRCPDAHAGL